MTLRHKTLIKALGTALGFLILGGLVVHYGVNSILEPLRSADWKWIFIAFPPMIGNQYGSAMGPASLLGGHKVTHLLPWSIIRVFLAVQPVSVFSPGRIADLGAIPLLRNHERPGAVASSIFLDKIITAAVLLTMAPFAFDVVWPNPLPVGTLSILGLCVVGLASAPFLVLHPRLRSTLNRTVLHRWPGALAGFGDHTRRLVSSSWLNIGTNLCVTAFKLSCSAALIYALARALHIELSVLLALCITILLQIANLLPISIMGLGIAEGSMVALFALLALPEAQALTLLFVSRIMFFCVLGGIYSVHTLQLAAETIGNAES